MVIYGPEGKYVRNGPGTVMSTPIRKRETRKATRLGPREYAQIKDILKGEVRHEVGPKLLFIGAYDVHEGVFQKVVLQKHEYMRLVDTLSGYERVESGPQTFVPRPHEESANGTESAVVLGTDLAVLTFNKTTGKRRLVTEGGVFTPSPYEQIVEIRKATLLAQRDFALVKNMMTGLFRHSEGPELLQVGAYEEVVHVKPKLVLEKDQYIRLMDEGTGEERIVRGPKTFVPLPSEVYPEGVKKANFLDTDTAILVLNESSGQERLIAEKGVFFPGPNEEILETRELIRVLPHEAVVVRDDKGNITIYTGSQDATKSAFFIPPYSVLVTHMWSDFADPPDPTTGIQAQKTVNFTNIDMRERTMFFSYEVRSRDNVKLNLDGNIFWRLMDVPKLMDSTADPAGDVWYHARSALIQAVSLHTLTEFMASFNNITAQAFKSQAQDGFYDERGVILKNMEVTKFETADPETTAILQKIIQESTNRVNRLAKQKGENDVKLAELGAEIKLETQRTEFIKAQSANKRLEAATAGQASGLTLLRAADSFIGGLNETVDNVSARVDLYKLHEQISAHNSDTKNLATGSAELYLTPSNVNLKIAMGGASAAGDRRMDDLQGAGKVNLQEL